MFEIVLEFVDLFVRRIDPFTVEFLRRRCQGRSKTTEKRSDSFWILRFPLTMYLDRYYNAKTWLERILQYTVFRMKSDAEKIMKSNDPLILVTTSLPTTHLSKNICISLPIDGKNSCKVATIRVSFTFILIVDRRLQVATLDLPKTMFYKDETAGN